VPSLLLHRVDERREEDVDLVDGAIVILVEQHLDRPDHLVEVRAVAELHDMRDDVRAEASEKSPGPCCRSRNNRLRSPCPAIPCAG
jgi:hypothetical protein